MKVVEPWQLVSLQGLACGIKIRSTAFMQNQRYDLVGGRLILQLVEGTIRFENARERARRVRQPIRGLIGPGGVGTCASVPYRSFV